MTHLLLESYLKDLKLPLFLKEYEQTARGIQSPVDYLETLCEKEVNHRYEKRIERLIKQAGFPRLKTLEGFDFDRVPGVNKILIGSLIKGDWITQKKNIIAVGNSGMGKTHLSIALGLLACQQGYTVIYKGVAQLSQELMEARDEKVLLRYKSRLEKYQVLILDELGYVPLTKEGAELLFDIFSSRHEKASIIVTTNLPFTQWTDVFLCPRLTGALLDRLTHKAYILEMNGESYRLQQSLLHKKEQKI